MKSRTLLRYHGGKWILAPWIISHFPEHRIYVEPFGGGGSVLLRKPRSYAEVYNDLNSEIVNLFRVVRDRGDELKELLRLTPFAREEYKESRILSSDPMELARSTVIRSFMGFGSTSIDRNTGFRSNSNRSGTTPAHDWANYPEALSNTIERLRGVVIENREAKEVMMAHDGENTLHYVDPPYTKDTRGKSSHYRFDFSEQDHIDLVEFLKTLKGKVIVSGYDSELYGRIFAGWRKETKKAFADGARQKVECLFLNF